MLDELVRYQSKHGVYYSQDYYSFLDDGITITSTPATYHPKSIDGLQRVTGKFNQ